MTNHTDTLSETKNGRKFVLLVDDNPGDLKRLARILQQDKGYEVINLFENLVITPELRDHPEAIVLAWLEERIRQDLPLPDVIVTDKAMYNKGDAAHALIEGVKKHADAGIRRLRFAVLTGDERAPRQYHGHPCYGKPVLAPETADKIEMLLNSNRAAHPS